MIPPLESAPAGSETAPDGEPYITTAWSLFATRTRASQKPGHANREGSAIGTRPRLRSASHWPWSAHCDELRRRWALSENLGEAVDELSLEI